MLEVFKLLEEQVIVTVRARQDAGASMLNKAGEALSSGDLTLADIMRFSFGRSQLRVDRARELLDTLRERQISIASAFEDHEVPLPAQTFYNQDAIQSYSTAEYDRLRTAAERELDAEVSAVSRIAKALGNPSAFVTPEGQTDEGFNAQLVDDLPSLGATITNILTNTAGIKNVGELFAKTQAELLAVSGISRLRFMSILFNLHDEGFVSLEHPETA